MKPTEEGLRALQRALSLPPDQRREYLREQAGEILRKHVNCSEILVSSPLVGDGPKQLPIRSTAAALRDNLSMSALVAIVAFGAGVASKLCEALVTPAIYARPSHGSKTGYSFGCHADWTTEFIDDLWAEAKALPAAPATTTTKDERMTNVPTEIANILAPIDITGKVPHPLLAVPIDALAAIYTHMSTDLGVSHGDLLREAPHASEEEVKRISAISSLIELDEKKYTASEAEALAVKVLNPLKTQASIMLAVGMLYNDVYAKHAPAKAPAEAAPIEIPPIAEEQARAVDALLHSFKLPKLSELIDGLKAAQTSVSCLKHEVTGLKAKLMAAPKVEATAVAVAAKGIPAGKVSTKKASALFPEVGGTLLDFGVPHWEWDHPHPHVPAADPDYVFREEELFKLLWAITTNKPTWLHGHTGTGKTTLVEQACARLNWPVMRVNFDSEITRMDLIGRDVLSKEGEATVSKFVDGILPQAMSGPYTLILDEIDFIRPDVSYVLQRVLESKGLVLTEDGGRLVVPHPAFRLVATANTQGQGDDYGMYAGARPQSMAMLDRFGAWIKVDYLGDAERKKLLENKIPVLDKGLVAQVTKYVREHIEAFMQGKVVRPISPRGMIALGEALATFTSMSSKPEAIKRAFDTTILDGANRQDAQVLRGLIDRAFK